ncbi:MAG: hypothetical protein ACRERV_01140, partial [Methylococcales bacterium]
YFQPGKLRGTPDEVTIFSRAVCGKTACTVRRAGRTTVLPDPYPPARSLSCLARCYLGVLVRKFN